MPTWRGWVLNRQLTERAGRLVEKTATAGCYRMYLVPAGDGLPERPALVRVPEGGVEITCEVWSLTTKAFGDFVRGILGPLDIGKVLKSGEEICGFVAEPRASTGAKDLSEYGGWK